MAHRIFFIYICIYICKILLILVCMKAENSPKSSIIFLLNLNHIILYTYAIYIYMILICLIIYLFTYVLFWYFKIFNENLYATYRMLSMNESFYPNFSQIFFYLFIRFIIWRFVLIYLR